MKYEYHIENRNEKNFTHSSLSKRMFIYYLGIIVLGTILLLMPFSLNTYTKTNGEQWTLIDSLFTASSAFSDTGLVVSVTAEQFNKIGQLVILLLIQAGGIGFLTLKVGIFMLIGKKIGIKDRLLLNSERGSSKLGGTLELIKTALIVIIVMEILGTIILGTYFFIVPVEGTANQHNILESLWHGFFHSVSAINNAGFDITGSSSLAPYQGHYFVQVVIMVLFITGGMGFPVIHDMRRWVTHKRSGDKKSKFKWSLFTKISVYTYVVVALIGLGITFYLEMLAPMSDSFMGTAQSVNGGDMPYADKIWALIFNTFSTRNAGFATVDLSQMSEGTLLTYSFMMFIGSAPSSTAGGIRTTTIALCFLALTAVTKGKQKINAFGREIKQSTAFNALVVFFVAIFLCFGVTLVVNQLMWSAQPDVMKTSGGLTAIWFEIASAFGTTGLSLGITDSLTSFSKLLIILVMFIGQLGVSATLLVWITDSRMDDYYELPEDDIAIG